MSQVSLSVVWNWILIMSFSAFRCIAKRNYQAIFTPTIWETILNVRWHNYIDVTKTFDVKLQLVHCINSIAERKAQPVHIHKDSHLVSFNGRFQLSTPMMNPILQCLQICDQLSNSCPRNMHWDYIVCPIVFSGAKKG